MQGTALEEKLDKIHNLLSLRDKTNKELNAIIGVMAYPKKTRIVKDYSISKLVMTLLNDYKPRRAAQIATELNIATGHEISPVEARSAAKYLVSRGRLTMNENKEFQLLNLIIE